jgi:hypothetical protein
MLAGQNKPFPASEGVISTNLDGFIRRGIVSDPPYRRRPSLNSTNADEKQAAKN